MSYRTSYEIRRSSSHLSRRRKSTSTRQRRRRHWREQKELIKTVEILIDLETEVLKANRGQKRGREESPEEQEEDKENVEPEGEWQV